MSNVNGQINIETNLGKIISYLASSECYKNYLEIGTWKGGGSTKCFADEILKRNDVKFISLESNKNMFDEALKLWNHKISDNFMILHGRIVEPEDLCTEEEIIKEKDFSVQWIDWLKQDLNSLKTCKNIVDILPSVLDVVLLDGGEFSSYSEFKILSEKTNIFILDDTNVLKNRKTRKILLEDQENWKCLFDVKNERNGYSVFCRKNILI